MLSAISHPKLSEAITASEFAQKGKHLERYNARPHALNDSECRVLERDMSQLPKTLRTALNAWNSNRSTWQRFQLASEVMTAIVRDPSLGEPRVDAARAMTLRASLDTSAEQFGKIIVTDLTGFTTQFIAAAKIATKKQDPIAYSLNSLIAAVEAANHHLTHHIEEYLIPGKHDPRGAQTFHVCDKALKPVLDELTRIEHPPFNGRKRARRLPRGPKTGPSISHLPDSGHPVGGIRHSRT